ncbi:MAG TPA: hypothetical protein VNG32_00385 [Candidatus Dormibacteraeota bacterium]|nr:hypothetical protein [Candidatus Dormibacteraeota bacterium]
MIDTKAFLTEYTKKIVANPMERQIILAEYAIQMEAREEAVRIEAAELANSGSKLVVSERGVEAIAERMSA